MDGSTLDYLYNLTRIASQPGNLRGALELFMAELRKNFVFDNVAIYIVDETNRSLEVRYARAIGRAKTAEADAAWGETFASQVVKKDRLLMLDPSPDLKTDDRLRQVYLLGLPMHMDQVRGALVFVRFGGPPYEQEHIKIASFGALLLSTLFERDLWRETHSELHDLKRQMQLQEDFVSTISHELRTPLGFIKGYSTSLLREDTTWDAETQQEFLMIIDEEADRLSVLIENVLESARLQSRTLQLRFQPLRLDSVIRDVIARLRVRHKDLNVSVSLDNNTPSVYGDGVRLAQVIENLFTNAIKYAPGAPISVNLEHSGENVFISFKDNGPGIDPESLPLIFDRFYRARNEKTITGTGLGLYICKQIIEAHRGKIWAESMPGQGTTFFIELPINSSKQAAQQSKDAG